MSSNDEIELLMKRYREDKAKYARAELDKSQELIKHFIDIAASKGVVLNSDAFSYVETIGIVAAAPGLAKKLLGITSSERDGLYSYDDITQQFPSKPFKNGYFVGEDYLLMAHPCYRRGMNPEANWAPRFVELFWHLNLSEIKKFIAIDENRVRVDVDGPTYMEEDTWYGAPFNKDISKIENGTIKLRPPLEFDPHWIDFFFAQSYCLDIKWSEAKQVKTFQALEMKVDSFQAQIDNQIYYPARYLHAEFDLTTNAFRHFDGAIQYFTKEEYFRRRDSDFNITFKDPEHIKARSTKVFKINGTFTIDLWVELCCHFFAANPLTIEYFTGAYPTNIRDLVDKLRASSV